MGSHDPSSHLVSIKSSFLTSQIRLLSQSLHTPSSAAGLPDAVLDKITAQVNRKITSHNRLYFGLESQRHVLEQVDGVYWRDVLATGIPDRKAETVVKRDVDFTEAATGHGGITGEVLPEIWEDVVLDPRPRKRRRAGNPERQDDDGETDADPGLPPHESDERVESANQQNPGETDPQAQQYAELNQRLRIQRARRDALRNKLIQYKNLQALLAPFEESLGNIQPNLVTRDNKDLEEEVARMRILLARVGNQIQARPQRRRLSNEYGTNADLAVGTKKLEGVLGLG